MVNIETQRDVFD